MKNMYKFLLLVAMLTISGSTFAQEYVKGQVTHAETGEPVEGADVRFIGSDKETITDANGDYQLEIVGTTHTLIISKEGYDQKRVNTRGQVGEIHIQLVPNIRYNQYGQIIERSVLDAEERGGILTFESPDRKFKFWFDNRIYLDGATYFDNYDHDLSKEENEALGQLDVPSQMLKLRRMRFAIKARVGDNWYGEIDFDFDGNIVDIKDAYLRRFFGEPGSPWGQFRIGQFRMPQGMQQTTTSRYLKLIERASVNEFNPNRRLGIGWNSWSKKYTFGLGIHTDEIRNEHDELEGDPNYFNAEIQGAKPMIGLSTKAAYYIINKPGELVSIGAGYSTRTPGIYKYPKSRIKYDPKDETKVSELEFVVSKVNGVDMATNINFEGAVSFGKWRMSGEYYWNTLSMEDESDNVNFSGFYVQSAYVIFGADKHNWNHREGEFTGMKPGKEGALEIAARYSNIDLNDFETNNLWGAKDQYTLGLNYYFNRNVKFMLNYSIVDHDRYATGDGDWEAYSNMYAPEGEGGFDYSFLTWRVEIDF